MTCLVLDASAGVRLVTRGTNWESIEQAIAGADETVAPGWYGVEVADALWLTARHGDIDAAQARVMLGQALELLDSQVAASPDLLGEALREAVRLGHPVYDLLYLVVARRTGAALVTADRRLAGIGRGLGLDVELV